MILRTAFTVCRHAPVNRSACTVAGRRCARSRRRGQSQELRRIACMTLNITRTAWAERWPRIQSTTAAGRLELNREE